MESLQLVFKNFRLYNNYKSIEYFSSWQNVLLECIDNTINDQLGEFVGSVPYYYSLGYAVEESMATLLVLQNYNKNVKVYLG